MVPGIPRTTAAWEQRRVELEQLLFARRDAYNIRLFRGEQSCLRGQSKMPYAIIRTSGKQFVVEEGHLLRIPSIDVEAGKSIELEALLKSGDSPDQEGSAVGATKVAATVVEHGRGAKLIVFKKKRRKQYKRKQGHRQSFTTIRIDSIG
jgi:large subunit ribosomal protein L21